MLALDSAAPSAVREEVARLIPAFIIAHARYLSFRRSSMSSAHAMARIMSMPDLPAMTRDARLLRLSRLLGAPLEKRAQRRADTFAFTIINFYGHFHVSSCYTTRARARLRSAAPLRVTKLLSGRVTPD